MTDDTPTVPTMTPPRWVNRMMEGLLRTPGIERWFGTTTALVTFTGRRSGTRYTTPVTYLRDGDKVIFVTKRFRTWWRNLEDEPEVELRLAGQDFQGRASIATGDRSGLDDFVRFLGARRRDARAYDVTVGRDGTVDEEQAAAVIDQLVVVTVTITHP